MQLPIGYQATTLLRGAEKKLGSHGPAAYDPAMLSWLRRKAQLAIVKGGREDLERFVYSLRGQSGAELGTLLVVAASVRIALRQSGVLPDELVKVTPDPQQAAAQLAVAQLVRRYQSKDRLEEAAGAMVWLHTMRALSIPELRLLGRQMWRELARGHDHVPASLGALGLLPFSAPGLETAKIPDDLDPSELK